MDHAGAYLVMVRGGDLDASGIALVTPLEIEVREETTAGRVRVTVRDSKTKDPLPGVQVKVIGTDNGRFLGGETDLRGVFTAEGAQGQVTAMARRGSAQHAFYRGTAQAGAPPALPGNAAADTPAPPIGIAPPSEH